MQKHYAKEVYDLFRELHPDLAERRGRIELLERLVGTRVTEALHILRALQSAPVGDICEFGCAQGATSALLASEADGRDLWLFDSFEGLPAPSSRDRLITDVYGLGSMEAYRGTMTARESEVRTRVAATGLPDSKLHIVRGFFPKSVAGRSDLPERIALAYIDFDFYEPIKAALEFLAPRLSHDAVVAVDDYGHFSSGAQAAVDEFCAERRVLPVINGVCHFDMIRWRPQLTEHVPAGK